MANIWVSVIYNFNEESQTEDWSYYFEQCNRPDKITPNMICLTGHDRNDNDNGIVLLVDRNNKVNVIEMSLDDACEIYGNETFLTWKDLWREVCF